MKVLRPNFGDLIEIFVSDLSNICMSGIVVEWVFGFCDFYQILRRGLGG